MLGKNVPPDTCFSAGARHAIGAPSLHQRLAIRLLIEADLYHVHAHIEAEYRAREGERRAPLSRAGLGSEPLDAGLLVVEGLSYGRIGFVAARRAHPLVFVVDLGRRIESPLQPARPIERGGTPLAVDLPVRFGDFDRAFR